MYTLAGRVDEAKAAFEAAEEEAVRNGYWMLAALAVRDLSQCVLEPSGQVAAHDRKSRLASHVQKLTGTREGLAAVLGDGYV